MLTALRICKFVFICVLVFACSSAISQSAGSIHIQSELPKQYSVLWNGNSFNSSGSGYLVIPEVPAGEQSLVLSFPDNAYPATAFSITVTDKARGLSLKLGINNTWSLFDMVDLYVMKGIPAADLKIARPAPPMVAKAAGIRKLFDKAGPDGIDQVYLIDNNGKTDTVALFIPVLEETKPRQSACLAEPGRAVPNPLFPGNPPTEPPAIYAILPRTIL